MPQLSALMVWALGETFLGCSGASSVAESSCAASVWALGMAFVIQSSLAMASVASPAAAADASPASESCIGWGADPSSLRSPASSLSEAEADSCPAHVRTRQNIMVPVPCDLGRNSASEATCSCYTDDNACAGTAVCRASEFLSQKFHSGVNSLVLWVSPHLGGRPAPFQPCVAVSVTSSSPAAKLQEISHSIFKSAALHKLLRIKSLNAVVRSTAANVAYNRALSRASIQ